MAGRPFVYEPEDWSERPSSGLLVFFIGLILIAGRWYYMMFPGLQFRKLFTVVAVASSGSGER